MTMWEYATCSMEEIDYFGELGWEAYAVKENYQGKVYYFVKRPKS